MLLKADNAPQNDLLAEGFDLQYTVREGGPFEDSDLNLQFADRYVTLPITWPYNSPKGRFGSGDTLINIVQAKNHEILSLESEGLLTMLRPEDKLMGIHLSEDMMDGNAIAKIRITYGTCYNDALYEEYLLATAKKQRVQ